MYNSDVTRSGMPVEIFSRLESRPWIECGVPFSPDDVEQALGANYGSTRPFVIYIHIPYCPTRCTFCALYTHALSERKKEELDRYLACLLTAIRRHPQLQAGYAPTTVHFGGGTPVVLGGKRLHQIVDALHLRIGEARSCEWALETTSSSVTRSTLSLFRSLAVSRVHLGIQTLDDSARERMARRESGEHALAKVALLADAGFDVSVDLLLGYPGLPTSQAKQDVVRLFHAGVRMFSFCALRSAVDPSLSPDALDAHESDALRQWQVVWTLMRDFGLKAIHTGQFARSDEDNLYYTHPARYDDCVALGPYAHGSCGDLHYRNRLVPDYYRQLERGRCAFAAGIAYPPELRIARQLERELLGHRICDTTLSAAVRRYGVALGKLVADWKARGWLVYQDAAPSLTAEGSWYVGNMVADVRDCAERDVHVAAVG